MIRAALIAAVALMLAAQPAAARVSEHGRDEVRDAGICGTGATATLRLKTDDNGIEARFALEQPRASALWRLTLVHERRVVWKTTIRTTRTTRSLDLRRTLPDLPGSDTVTAHAWGPHGLTCRATATLTDA